MRDQSGLARPVGADEAEDLAPPHVEVDVVDRAQLAEVMGELESRRTAGAAASVLGAPGALRVLMSAGSAT